MSKFLLLTKREIQERLGQKGFWYMLVLGPLVVLLILVALLKAADQGKQELQVLIADPGQIMDHRLMAQEEKYIHYYYHCFLYYSSLHLQIVSCVQAYFQSYLQSKYSSACCCKDVP